jgi:Right handed beta helix region
MATRTWVSGVGNDANPGSRTAPCKTFAGAISKTANPGEIDCLDPGGFGAVTITKSVTLDGTGTFGSILASATTGVIINGAGINVTLRKLSINGVGASPGLTGVRIVNANAVHIIDCMIFGFTGSPGRGIDDQRTGGGRLFVVNTVVRDNTIGIQIKPSSGGSAILGFIDRCTITANSSSGVLAGAGSRVAVSNSLVSGNPGNGLFANFTAALSGPQINVESCMVVANGTGINVDAGAFCNISNVYLTTNSTGMAGGGTYATFGNNHSTLNSAGDNVPGAPPPIPPK